MRTGIIVDRLGKCSLITDFVAAAVRSTYEVYKGECILLISICVLESNINLDTVGVAAEGDDRR